MRVRSARIGVLVTLPLAMVALVATAVAARSQTRGNPIEHVVVIYQENHSFDEMLGRFCVQTSRCDGATEGKIHDGTTIPLATAADIVPPVGHARKAQEAAIDGGAMDGFDLIAGCDASTAYACYRQYDASAIPNFSALADAFVVSDATFENSTAASWASHLDLVSSTMDGFYGNNPHASVAPQGPTPGPGWGCDSRKDTLWSANPEDEPILVPSCVPDRDGNGPYRPSPVPWVPTIMDRFDAAGLTWKLYAGGGPHKPKNWRSGYYWQVCATFYECQGSSQIENWVANAKVLSDAAAGTLPNLALVTPKAGSSQHNDESMIRGDNWIGSVVSAIENGPDWDSTVIFITYDDCGCFYDHVPPPTGLGIRVPMVIVSPYARAGYTDHEVASFNSMLAYAEHLFGLLPLSSADGTAYDFAGAFDYSQTPLPPVRMVERPIPSWEVRYLEDHPIDEDDPT